VNTREALAAHQPLDPTPADLEVLAQAQLGVDPPDPVGASSGRVDVDDRVEQVRIVDITRGRSSATPLVVARS
jgi:hypothetical protein